MAKKSSTPISKQHIVLCGPMGVGKSTIARPLAAETGLPVFSLDRLRNLPHLDIINSELVAIRQELLETDQALLREFDPKKFAELKKERDSLLEDIEIWESQRQLREDPRIGDALPNYDDMKYDFRVSARLMEIAKANGINKNIAWHYYQNYFEIMLMKQFVSNLGEKAIIDLGGNMPIVLAEECLAFERILEGMGQEGAELLAAMPLRAKDMPKATEDVLELFDKSKIVSLHLAPTYNEPVIDGAQNPDYNEKAAKSNLNPYFVNSGQFDAVAGVTIETQGMVQYIDGQTVLNAKVGEAIAATIVSRTAEKTDTNTLSM